MLLVFFIFIVSRLIKKLEHSWKALVYDGVSFCQFVQMFF